MTILPEQRRTKIVCTMGPACKGSVLPRLVAAGMNVARLNFSHGTREEHGAWIRRIREVSERLKTPVAILQDLAGPKVRIGEVPDGEMNLEDGDEFFLVAGSPMERQKVVTVNYPQIIVETPVGARILLADGNIELKVEEKVDRAAPAGGTPALRCRVVAGGVLRSQVGINFPGHSLSVPALTAKDYDDLAFGLAQGVDFVALSYVRSARDVSELREFIRGRGADTPIIAKIENHEALGQLQEILDAADGLMVARGDLGVEVPLERVPMIQKQIIAAANRVGKPVITATQMLLSMVSQARPSRAEATDVANAILDGTDAVMLSEETAVGQYPVEAVTFLDLVSRATEQDFPHEAWLRARASERRKKIPEAVSYAACEMALDLEAAAILTSTDGGGTARLISRFRPRNPIIALTSNPSTWRRLCLTWGVLPLLTPPTQDIDEMLRLAVQVTVQAGLLNSGDRVIITAGTPVGSRGTTNLIKAATIA